jgi:hypothetical protein
MIEKEELYSLMSPHKLLERAIIFHEEEKEIDGE